MNELQVKKFELPNLEIIDYDKYLELAKKDTNKYKKYIVTEETLDLDTKKRAELRKVAKAINDRRLEIEKEISVPIKEFKTKCDVIVNLYKESADLIDNQIKVFEQQEKDKRKKWSRKIYEDNIEELKELVQFEKVFNEKWLNKGVWKEEGFSSVVENEIKELVEKVRNGLKAIEELNSEFELELKNTFLNDFDITGAIFKNTLLLEQKEKMEQSDKKKEEIVTEKVENMLKEEVKEETLDPIQTYTLKITASLTKLKKLREFLDLNNMEYEKVK